ncbi:serine/arginine-rich splicing factor 4-like isoform X2 [Sycon ciliatum]|uniref:serine/arginine-rich splicing factor 4-like isoform X2 n=1 Tax=Sycon ciliatum TaxID=27933 RepID=UPI0020AC9990|eukprot:scpid63039/ scgid0530/ 
MASTPEPAQGLGVFCVINGDENRCRPEAVRKFFLDEVGSCRVVTSSRSYSNEKTFVTMEFTSRQNAQFAMSKTGSKVNGCRISASPYRSRRLGNLIGQDGPMMHNNFHNNRFQHFGGGGGGRGGFRGGGMPNHRGNFQPFMMKRGRSWGEQESEKVRGMSPKTAARYIENRIREKEERTHQRVGKSSSYSRSRSRSHSLSRSRSRSPYRRSYSRHTSDESRSRSPRSRSPRRKSRRSRSSSRSSVDSYKARRRSRSEDSESEERKSRERRRRHKKRKRRHHSYSSSEHHDRSDQEPAERGAGGELVRVIEDWASQDVTEVAEVAEIPHAHVTDPEVIGKETMVAATEVGVVVDEAVGDDQAAHLPPLPSTQLDLAIPSTLSLALQQDALQKRHHMQQEFEADVGTISSVAEMLRRHDQTIGVQLRHALQSVVGEVTAKYSGEFDDYLNSTQQSKPATAR